MKMKAGERDENEGRRGMKIKAREE